MGNCGSSLDCQRCYAPASWGNSSCLSELEVDSDIAGIGVLTAFLSTAVITCITIFLGYISDSLPASVLSDEDRLVISWIQSTASINSIFRRLSGSWGYLKSSVFGRRQHSPGPTHTLTRDQRVEAVTRIVLALSDQQLITGIAIITAAIGNRCTISLFEFRIVSCLAWFSATTHLATLDVLQDYMRHHPVVRNCRVIGMVSFLILLAFMQAVTVVVTPQYFNHSVWTSCAKPLQCIFAEKPLPPKLSIAVVRAIVLVYTIVAYSRKMGRFYSRSSKPGLSGLTLSGRLLYLTCIRKHNGASKTQVIDIIKQVQDYRQVPITSVFVLRVFQYYHSFLSTVSSILLYLTIGLSQTALAVWYTDINISSGNRRLGFGQLISVALLALPALVAIEVFNEQSAQYYPRAEHVIDDPHPIAVQQSTAVDSPEPESTPSFENEGNHPNDFYTPPQTTKRGMAICFVLSSVPSVIGGAIYPLSTTKTSAGSITLMGFPYEMLLLTSLFVFQEQRIWVNWEIAKIPRLGTDDLTKAGSNGPASTNPSNTSTGSSNDTGNNQEGSGGQHTEGETDHDITPLGRQDTEADIAMVPLEQRFNNG